MKKALFLLAFAVLAFAGCAQQPVEQPAADTTEAPAVSTTTAPAEAPAAQ